MLKIEFNNKFTIFEKYGSSYIKGYAFHNGELLKGEYLYINLLEAVREDNLEDFLSIINGSFSAVISYQGETFLISDKIKSFPLLYQHSKTDTIISDCIEHFNIDINHISSESEMEFLSCGYLSFDRTLLDDVFQVGAGMYVRITDVEVIKYNYHNFIQNKNLLINDVHLLYDQAELCLKNSFGRFLASINNRQIVIPLSGGYDSRLIACLCRVFKIANVVCYTYGRKDSFEVKVSEQVANHLGYKWIFIEYTKEKILNLANQKAFVNYLTSVHNLNSIPHFQDYLAIQELNINNLIDSDAVIVPGHSGDLLGGSKIPDTIRKINKDELVASIYNSFFDLCRRKYNNKKINYSRIYKYLSNYRINTLNDFLNIYECIWFDKSKIPNFIVNSMRVYESFGYDWRLPLWDDEYVSFWYSLPWSNKSNSILYDNFMFERFFKKYSVNIIKKFDKRIIDSRLKKIIPKAIIDLLRFIYVSLLFSKYDFNSQSIQSDLVKLLNFRNKSKKYNLNKENDLNSLIALYILNNLHNL